MIMLAVKSVLVKFLIALKDFLIGVFSDHSKGSRCC